MTKPRGWRSEAICLRISSSISARFPECMSLAKKRAQMSAEEERKTLRIKTSS